VLPSIAVYFSDSTNVQDQRVNSKLFDSLAIHVPATRYDGVHVYDMARLTNGLRIKRAKKKMNLINERQEVYTTYFAAVTSILPLF